MDSPSELTAEELLQRLTADGAPQWDEPGDLSRMSINAFAEQHELGRVRPSQGRMRLFGEETANHSARLEQVGNLMAKLQRMVLAFGASLEGNKSQTGRISTRVIRDTRLLLVASPSPGSLVLDVAPEAPIEAQLPDHPQLPETDEQLLVDQTVAGIVDVFGAFASSPDDDLEHQVNELGPRFATAIRNFANEMHEDGLAVELTWQIPGREPLRARVGVDDAARISDFVSSRKLDSEAVELRGVLRTISDRSKWEVELDDGIVRMDASAVPVDVVNRLNVGQVVDISAKMTVRTRPGGAETTRYEVVEVRD